jgi:hypothetical protein
MKVGLSASASWSCRRSTHRSLIGLAFTSNGRSRLCIAPRIVQRGSQVASASVSGRDCASRCASRRCPVGLRPGSGLGVVAARQVVTSCTWPFESCYPAGYPPPRAHAPSRSRCASVRASSRPPIRVRFWRAAAFSGNGPRTSVLYRRFLVFGLRALALTELRRMQQRVSRSTNRETEFNCCHFQKFSCG